MVATKLGIPSLGASLSLFIKLAVLTLLFSEFFFFFFFAIFYHPLFEERYQGELKLPLCSPLQLTTLTCWLILIAYMSFA